MAVREILELGAFGANIVTGIAAVVALRQLHIGLRQLHVSKRDVELRSEREAGVLSVQLCERWAREITPEAARAIKAIDNAVAPGKPSKDFLKSEVKGEADAWIKMTFPHRADIMTVLNSMESVAMYFEIHLAEEKFAFGPLAVGLVDICNAFWPWIAVFRPEDAHQLYPNLVSLYARWSTQLEAVGLDLKAKKITEQLSALSPVAFKRPIGTQV